MSANRQPENLQQQVVDRVREKVIPLEREVSDEVFKVHPRWAALRKQAREDGLWNLFLPRHLGGPGLSNLQYAPIAEATGLSPLAPAVFNCQAPDSGNMELLAEFASDDQKKRWLEPLLAGEIHSAFCMTEPQVASSDATNIESRIDISSQRIVIHGSKWWSTGVGHPDCELLLFLGVSDADGPRHRRHSIVLVPRDAPGVNVGRMLPVLGMRDAPFGHGEVTFDKVELPPEALLGDAGAGFAMAQSRLGPGRIHHCMRLIGACERAMELMCRRGLDREAFGRPLLKLGANPQKLAQCRVAIEQARLLVLQAAREIDENGSKAARGRISQIKLVVPAMAQRVIDQAMQIHGAAGLSDRLPLAALFAQARALRLADGPDEVHARVVAREEMARYESK